MALVLAAEFPPAEAADPPVTKTRLPNGLRVVIAPERVSPSPVVSVTVGYQVGQADDPAGREELAHLVEHMMFRGSDGVADGEHYALVREAGGYTGGSTKYRYSTYNSTVPSNQLELILFLESARMRNLRMTQTALENQVKAVEAELLPSRDRVVVAGALVRTVVAAGRPLNIESTPLTEAQAFYDRFYGPNNAVIVVSGDVDVTKASRLISRYFAKLPTIQSPQRSPANVRPAEARHFLPHPTRRAVFLAYPVPLLGSREDEALRALVAFAGDGPDARLRKRLVGGGVASDVGVGLRDAGPYRWLIVNAAPGAGRSMTELEAAISNEVAALAEGIAPLEAIVRIRDSALLQHARDLVIAETRAELFVEAELLGAGPGDVVQRPAVIRRISSAAIQGIARKYLQAPRLVVAMDQATAQREDPR